jgi:lipopolysaccharide transport system ATP-binding protein
MSEPVIRIENLGKRYVIGQQRSQEDGLRHVIEDAVRAPLKWLKGGRGEKKPQPEEFWAIKDISFEVHKGDVVGIIGRNGAGKSTLLKILSRITEPTHGRVQIDGRVASLLEVGTGFHVELTGRENIFLNGAILGMNKAEIKRKFDEIVDFSGIEKFIDTPVKRFSSGMQVRLAFAVAAHLEPEILIVDEVLAVGDATFQKKCIGKMQNVSSGGRTVLFVSHNMAALASLCHRAVWLDNGRMVGEGRSRDLITAYLNRHGGETADARIPLAKKPRIGSGTARFTALELKRVSPAKGSNGAFHPGDTISVTVEITSYSNVNDLNVGVTFYDAGAYRLVDVNTALKGEFLTLEAGKKAAVSFVLHDLRLKPGRYGVELWLGRGGLEHVDFVRDADNFEVQADMETVCHTEEWPGPYQCQFTHAIQPLAP